MSQGVDPRRWLVEGAVIVFSILLAFALDAAWDRRVERDAEQDILASLTADFEAVADLLPDHTLGHSRTAAALGHFVELVRDAPVGSVVLVPDTAIVLGIRNASFDAPSGAVDALLSSGNLRLISDPELRRMLAAWPSRLRDATEDDQVLRELSGPELRRILAQDINLLIPLSRGTRNNPAYGPAHMAVTVTDPLRGVLPVVRGSSGLAAREEGELMVFVDSILVRLREARRR